MIDHVRAKRRMMLGVGLGLFLLMLITLPASGAQHAQATPEGETIFKDKCSRCHTIGGGIKRGPDLQGITQIRDQQWLVDFITSPRQVIASGDTTANALLSQFNNNVMPDPGLSQEQVLAVIGYLAEQSGAAAVTPTVEGPGSAPVSGNAERGKALFIHQVKLENDGPACISCHRIDNVGILGGGTMGRDLTEASGIFGESGIVSVLTDIPFPLMASIFADHPLTDAERADLAAFITSQSGQPPVNKEILILALSLAGFLGVMAVGAFYWRGRLRHVWKRLVDQARSGIDSE